MRNKLEKDTKRNYSSVKTRTHQLTNILAKREIIKFNNFFIVNVDVYELHKLDTYNRPNNTSHKIFVCDFLSKMACTVYIVHCASIHLGMHFEIWRNILLCTDY